ncbi:MAG: chorismate mutase [Treponema sp.]|jgi:chorismate mutase|nr:chorismate mutase [Treponema sp.]
MSKKLFALRGAAQALNTAEDIEKWTVFLYDGLLKLNKLEEDDIVSVVFSVTRDLDEENPAAALRHAGRAAALSLFAVQEAFVKDGLPRAIRILIHCYLDEGAVGRHFYCNGAEALRPDRTHSNRA